jgi:mannose-1-phosphate guanylyltransferase
MKAIIFAGGAGTRLWPLSRRKSPKQFEKVIGDKSTLQLAMERLTPDFNWEDLYVATSAQYIPLVSEQLPKLHTANIIGEPDSRDVGPAVGLVTAILNKQFPDSPMVILWSDHIVRQVDLFKKILSTCEDVIKTNKDKIIFISQKPRFASQNLGWIKYGDELQEKNGVEFYSFEKFIYRPPLETATKFFRSGHYAWNLGYFVTTPGFIWKLYEEHQPEMFKGLQKIAEAHGTADFQKIVDEVYPTLPKISFDNAILEKINPDAALVVSEELGWSDVGAWEALKEALQTSPEQNVIKGKVLVTDCQDTLVYNYSDQLVVTIDLNGFLVINTHDVTLVCHKNSVPKIKKLVEKLAESENEHLV